MWRRLLATITSLPILATSLEITSLNIRFRNGQSLVEQSKFIFGMSHFLFPFSFLFLSIPPALSPKSINEGHWFSKPQTLGQWRHRLYSIDL